MPALPAAGVHLRTARETPALRVGIRVGIPVLVGQPLSLNLWGWRVVTVIPLPLECGYLHPVLGMVCNAKQLLAEWAGDL